MLRLKLKENQSSVNRFGRIDRKTLPFFNPGYMIERDFRKSKFFGLGKFDDFMKNVLMMKYAYLGEDLALSSNVFN
jgi:hypothetical protein